MSLLLDQTLTDATARNLSLAQTLEALLDRELEARHQRSIERRFKLSRLQSKPSIDSFHFNHHKSRLQLKTRILRLLDLDFLRNGTSVCLIGNPGVGKTYLAKIVGWRACQANQRVLFTTAMDMLNHLLASQVDHSLIRKLKIYTEPSLVTEMERAGGRQFEVMQVKEKFGGLRFYVNCRKEEAIRQRIGVAAQESFRTCEVCGQPGKLRELRCIKTLCDEHDASARGEK